MLWSLILSQPSKQNGFIQTCYRGPVYCIPASHVYNSKRYLHILCRWRRSRRLHLHLYKDHSFRCKVLLMSRWMPLRSPRSWSIHYHTKSTVHLWALHRSLSSRKRKVRIASFFIPCLAYAMSSVDLGRLISDKLESTSYSVRLQASVVQHKREWQKATRGM